MLITIWDSDFYDFFFPNVFSLLVPLSCRCLLAPLLSQRLIRLHTFGQELISPSEMKKMPHFKNIPESISKHFTVFVVNS